MLTSDEAAYAGFLEEAMEWIADQEPDLVIYQAGVDSNKDDIYSRAKVSEEFLYERDK
jgi:acetoin utilization deacetylase AcuC-like enzyme